MAAAGKGLTGSVGLGRSRPVGLSFAAQGGGAVVPCWGPQRGAGP